MNAKMPIPDWYTPVSEWPHVIAEAAVVGISPDDAALIMRLASAITKRWRDRANAESHPVHAESRFEELYRANERNAKGAIVAILELVKTVGDGQPLLAQYEELLK